MDEKSDKEKEFSDKNTVKATSTLHNDDHWLEYCFSRFMREPCYLPRRNAIASGHRLADVIDDSIARGEDKKTAEVRARVAFKENFWSDDFVFASHRPLSQSVFAVRNPKPTSERDTRMLVTLTFPTRYAKGEECDLLTLLRFHDAIASQLGEDFPMAVASTAFSFHCHPVWGVIPPMKILGSAGRQSVGIAMSALSEKIACASVAFTEAMVSWGEGKKDFAFNPYARRGLLKEASEVISASKLKWEEGRTRR